MGSLGCERSWNTERFCDWSVVDPKLAREAPTRCVPGRFNNRKSRPMLFWIAAIGSTWGAYALEFERLVGVSDRAQASHGGSEERVAQKRRKTEGQAITC